MHRPGRLRTRLSIRTVLLLGFGLTLGLWLLSGYYFARRVNELQAQSAEVTTRYIRAQARMSAVRNEALLASVYARDALLDPVPESIVEYRLKLDEAFRIIDRALQQYEPVLDTASESTELRRLRIQTQEFKAAILDVLASDSTRWHSDALTLLREHLMPKRQEVLQVSDDVQTINRAAYVDQQAATATIYRLTQQRIWTQFGLAVAASFFIGLVAIRHAGRLESEVRQQQERDAKTSAELQLLSARLLSAQEDERRTLARELHDEVGQALSAIKMELALAERDPQASAHPGNIEAARRLTDGVIQSVRDLSRLLHPAVLDDIGLPAAVDAYVREFRKRYSVDIEFTSQGTDARLEPEVEAAAYRIVQEALTNVVRHANASNVRVSICRDRDLVRLLIEDDGDGFAMDRQTTSPAGGLGLVGMRERASRLGGTFTVDSSPGMGTRVHVTIPTVLIDEGRLVPQLEEAVDG